MKITLPYTFTESVIPPRCRKPRKEQFKDKITLTVREVSKDDAPIAIIQHDHNWDDEGNRVPKTTEYRFYKGKLYTNYSFQRVCHGEWETQTANAFSEDPYPHSTYDSAHEYWYQSKAERRKTLMGWAKTVLMIDGERWGQEAEPRYVIQTFGLGHNHGGTSVFADNHYNGNISKDRYFRIDQVDLMLESAKKIALRRGDDKSLPFDDEYLVRFDILNPEALKLKPAKEHGNGCEFINQCESIISNSPDAYLAGLGLIANLLR